MSAHPDVDRPRPTGGGEMRTGTVLGLAPGGFHRIAYTDWGDPGSERVAVCVHGLSRQGRDFDPLAGRLARLGWRVVCPDLPGRGRSDWLGNPDQYDVAQYVVDMTVLLARLGVAQVDWVGTSLGGIVGMVLAGSPGSPIRRLVINDVGPYLPWAAVRRIGNQLRSAPARHASLAEAMERLRNVHAPFGPLTDEQWHHLAKHSFVPIENGEFRPHFDPAIGEAFRLGRVYSVHMWHVWDRISCPVLLLRGEHSDLLLPETAQEMTRRGPRATLVEIAGCGHAPALLDDGQVRIVTDWLTVA